MAKDYRLNWQAFNIKRKASDPPFIYGGVMAVLCAGMGVGLVMIDSDDKKKDVLVAEDRQQAERIAGDSEIIGPGQMGVQIGVLKYTFDFNSSTVLVSGEGQTFSKPFSNVQDGHLAKAMQKKACSVDSGKQKFGPSYCR